MAKTLIDLDDDFLTRAQLILKTTTKKDTVNAALREVVRRDAAARFLQLGAYRVFDDPDGTVQA
jgi:Arc/MetJ family transcription regulator